MGRHINPSRKLCHATIATELRARIAARPDILWADLAAGLCSVSMAMSVAREYHIERPIRKRGTFSEAQMHYTKSDADHTEPAKPPTDPDELPQDVSIAALADAARERAEEMIALAPTVSRRIKYAKPPRNCMIEYVDPEAIALCLRIAHRWIGYAINYSKGGTPRI